jgi:hypothetical protein
MLLPPLLPDLRGDRRSAAGVTTIVSETEQSFMAQTIAKSHPAAHSRPPRGAEHRNIAKIFAYRQQKLAEMSR